MTQDSQTKQADIVIVGGGIVGLTLARCLRDSGLSMILVDRPAANNEEDSDCLPYRPRVSALTLASMSLLEQCGAGAAINAACAFDCMEVWDGAGTGHIRYEAAEMHQKQLGVIVENDALISALDTALAGQRDLQQIHAGLQGLERLSGPYAHELALDNGQRIQARLVVAADGGRSQLRALAGFNTREWDYGHHAIVTTVALSQPHQDTAWQVFLPSGPLALLPLRPRLDSAPHCVSIVWSCQPARHDELMALDDRAFADQLTRASEGRLGEVEQVNKRVSFPLRQRHAREYVQDGIALVGDAAHTIHPLAGQGVNLGLQDARVLAEVITATRQQGRDFAHRQSLSAYPRQRKADNLLMMATMEGFKRLFEQDDLGWRWLRNRGMSLLNQQEGLKRTIMARAMGL